MRVPGRQSWRRARLLAASAVALLGLLSILTRVEAQKAASGNKRGAYFLQQAQKASDGIVQVRSAAEYDQLVATPREYSVSMLLTALDSPPINCVPCKNFAPTYSSLSGSFKKAARASKTPAPQHIFAVLEFKEGREIFQRLKVTYAPVLMFYPATAGPNASPSADPETYDFNREGFEGADIAEDISQRINMTFRFRKPFPWRMAGITLSVMVLTTSLGFVIVPRLSSYSLSLGSIIGAACKAATLSVILVMCAGHMWNGIRGAPYVSADGKYFASGFQNQNAAETQIVAVVYGILAFAFTSLAVLVPMQRDPVKQRAGVYIWSVILLIGFSLLLYIFRLKNPSYPFRLFF